MRKGGKSIALIFVFNWVYLNWIFNSGFTRILLNF